MIKYIGKCILIESQNKKIVAIGDVHLGYGNEKEHAGVIVNKVLFEEMMKDIEMIFSNTGKVDKIILLGDLKHDFSALKDEERYGIVNFIDHIERKCEEIIFVKGNHDNYAFEILKKKGVKTYDYFIDGKYCFLHGDRDFVEIYDKRIEYWVMGHMHPAIKLRDGNKTEKFKCFLSGDFEGKKIIILPSFAESGGIDVREIDKKMPWKFKLGDFKVKIVGENLEVLDFGKLKEIY